MNKEKTNLKFVVNGRELLLNAIEHQMEAARVNIQQEIDAKYAPQLAVADFLGRLKLLLHKRKEFARRLAEEVEKIKSVAPPDALY